MMNREEIVNYILSKGYHITDQDDHSSFDYIQFCKKLNEYVYSYIQIEFLLEHLWIETINLNDYGINNPKSEEIMKYLVSYGYKKVPSDLQIVAECIFETDLYEYDEYSIDKIKEYI